MDIKAHVGTKIHGNVQGQKLLKIEPRSFDKIVENRRELPEKSFILDGCKKG